MQATVVRPGGWSYQLIICLLIIPLGLFALRVEAAAEEYLFSGESPSLSVDLLVPAPAEGETVDIDAPGFNWLSEEEVSRFHYGDKPKPGFPGKPSSKEPTQQFPSATYVSFPTALRTNWYYECFKTLVAGKIKIQKEESHVIPRT